MSLLGYLQRKEKEVQYVQQVTEVLKHVFQSIPQIQSIRLGISHSEIKVVPEVNRNIVLVFLPKIKDRTTELGVDVTWTLKGSKKTGYVLVGKVRKIKFKF